MRRDEFDHVLRAAAAVLGESELIVIGSQAIHASVAEPLPSEAARSVEVDVVPLDDADGRQADVIDGSIGEASMFHETFGVYAQGVTTTTATLADGWRGRLVAYTSPAAPGVTAWCLELADLWLAKALAGRSKDREFCVALSEQELVDTATVRERLHAMQGVDASAVARVQRWLDAGARGDQPAGEG